MTVPAGSLSKASCAAEGGRFPGCGERFFLFVGVMRYYKGLHILLEAAQGTDYPIIIVGAGPLEAELKAEKAALSLAKEAYALEAAKPEIARQKNSDGTVSTYRNMAKFNEKMKPLQAEVDNHQNNIELLQKELNGMR